MFAKSLKLIAIILATPITSSIVYASPSHCTSKVTMNFYAEKWLQSNNSEVTININASSPADKADAISKTFNNKLSEISNQTQWKITAINSSESESGLLKINAQATARIDNDKLGELRTQLAKLNTPGEQYKITSINNHAELSTINNNKTALRKEIFKQVINGEKELNAAKLDSQTNYKIFKIFFKDRTMNKPVMYVAASAKNMRANTNTAEKMYMSAQATYAICAS